MVEITTKTYAVPFAESPHLFHHGMVYALLLYVTVKTVLAILSATLAKVRLSIE